VSLASSRAKLTGAAKDLQNLWDRTLDHWDDVQARDFDERQLDPLRRQVKNAADAMSSMSEQLSRARSECQ
jgi:hypothetical protein